MPVHGLEVGKTYVPTVGADVLRAEAALFGGFQYRNEVVVLRDLCLPLFGNFVQAAIARQVAQAVRP